MPNPTHYLLIFILLSSFSVFAQSDEESYDARAARLVQAVAETDDFADWLANYEGWQGDASPHDSDNLDGGWYIEFHDAKDEEWLGYANVDIAGTIEEAFIPRPLPDNELAAGKTRVRELVLADPEVATRIQDPLLWDIESDYDRFETHWNVNFYRGLEHLRVVAGIDDEFYIKEIRNERTLDEDEAAAHARDEAIRLAYEEVGSALDGLDDWHTYVEHQGGARWSVAFVAGGAERFYALVDVESQQVLESDAR